LYFIKLIKLVINMMVIFFPEFCIFFIKSEIPLKIKSEYLVIIMGLSGENTKYSDLLNNVFSL